MIALTQEQRDAVSLGKCPYCERSIRGYKFESGPFAPERWQTQRELGVDPATGHKADCPHKDIRL